MPTPEEISRKYRDIFLKTQRSFLRRYQAVFEKVADDFARLSKDPNVKFTRSFKFPPDIEKKIMAITTVMHDDLLNLTQEDIKESWALSNQKNDRIVKTYLSTIKGIKDAQEASYLLPNTSALKAFISRKENAETLSSLVWKVANQARKEMETHLGIGIVNGDSSKMISQRIRQYLNNPDVLFRRVRDANGKLIASKAMQEYHPGQGVYRSSYKNALRVARSETNQAYLMSDHVRWAQMDMVIGIKISLSAQHPEYDFPEICEVLEGIYPKTFVFRGFHPHCLCHKTPVLMPEADFRAYLKGDIPFKAAQITEYPESFTKFWQENYERFSGYKSMPYVMKDNIEVIERAVGIN